MAAAGQSRIASKCLTQLVVQGVSIVLLSVESDSACGGALGRVCFVGELVRDTINFL